MTARRCKGTTKAGKPCQGYCSEGTDYCSGHLRQVRHARGEPIGYHQRRAAARAEQPQQLTTQADLRDWFAGCLVDLREGRLERLRFTAIAGGMPSMREQIRAAQEPDAEQQRPSVDPPPSLSDEEIIARIVAEAGPERVAAASGGKLRVIDEGKAS